MARKPLKPCRQGILDGLCAVYCLINTKRLLFPRTRKNECLDLFAECMDWLDSQTLLADALVNGMGINTLVGLSREVLEPSTPGLVRTRPFYRKQVSLDEFWIQIENALGVESTVVLLGFETKTWGHWTLAVEGENHLLKLFDSGPRRCLYKHHCSLSKPSKMASTQLFPAQTLIYKRIG